MKPVEALYDKNMTCIYCTLSYTSKRVRVSAIRVVKRDTDFCTYFSSVNPLFYEFYICPNCGLAYTEGFSSISKEKKDKISSSFLSQVEFPYLCRSRSIEDALQGYKLVVLCANLLGERRLILGNLFLRLAWLYRYQGIWETEQRYIYRSVKMYEQAYQTEYIEKANMEEDKLLYLMGELYARLGNYEKTKIHFGKLFSKKSASQKWKTTARDRWLDIRHNAASLSGDDPEGYNTLHSKGYFTR